jgi:hypothetical protein
VPYTLLDYQTHCRIEKYAEAAGTTVRAAIKDALNEWMDVIGDPILQLIDERTTEAHNATNGRRKPRKVKEPQPDVKPKKSKSNRVLHIAHSPMFSGKPGKEPPNA